MLCHFCPQRTSELPACQKQINETNKLFKEVFDGSNWRFKSQPEKVAHLQDKPICSQCVEYRKQRSKLRTLKRREKEKRNKQFQKTASTALKQSLENSNEINLLKKEQTSIQEQVEFNASLVTVTASKVYDANFIHGKNKEQKNRIQQQKILIDSQGTIYQWKDSKKHQIGWIFFFILIPLGIYHFLKLKKKKKKIDNSLDEIKDKFNNWRFSIYSSLVFFILFFTLSEQALKKFRPQLERFVNNYQNLAFGFTALLLGGLLILDGFISSNLKTNLQGLSFNVEKVVSDKELKKQMFFKTQDSTETLKENFKRFGMLAIPTMIVSILGSKWKNHWLSYGYYLIPVVYSFIRIWEVERLLKKIKLS